MKKILKQVLGIDVAQKELVTCLGRMYEDFETELFARKTFANNQKGFLAMVTWIKKLTADDVSIRFVMEATGVYHESVAYFLESKGYAVSIVLPNKISNYFRTLDVKSSTDQTASQAITLFGLERKLKEWKPPKQVFKFIKQLSREYDQIISERTVAKNQLHAENAQAFPNKKSLERTKARIRLLNRQACEIKNEIIALTKDDPKLNRSVEIICSIPGVGMLTAATVLAETNGFELILNKRQLTSYAGFDVVEKQSGTSIRVRPKISKRGNKHLRKAMHMPALSAIRHCQKFKNTYARIVALHGIKMKAAVAIQRKLLELIYTLHKKDQPFEENFEIENQQNGIMQNRQAIHA